MLKKSFVKASKYLSQLRWIDVVGIGIFFAILAIILFFFLRKGEYVVITLEVSQSHNPTRINITSREEPPFWYTQYLKPGLKETDGLGRTNVEVVDVYKYISSETSDIVYVSLRVKSTYNKRTNQYLYKGLPLLIGSGQSFRLQGVLVNGIVTNIDISDFSFSGQQKEFIVTAFLHPINHSLGTDNSRSMGETIINGIPTYLSKQIQKGLLMKDNQGQVIAEIIEVTKSPATQQFIYRNSLVSVADRERVKINLKLKLIANKGNDYYYFRSRMPLIVGSRLYLNFIDFVIKPTITNIEMLVPNDQ